MKPRVVVTHWVHPEAVDLLSHHCDVVANRTRESLPRSQILSMSKIAAALMAFMPDRIDEEFLDACPSLKIISCAFKGSDNIDVEDCTRRGIWVTIAPDLLSAPTAELAVGLLLGLARNLAAGDHFVREGSFRGWRPHLYGTGLAGRRAGIVGMGNLGQAIAQRLAGFEAKVFYYDSVRLPRQTEVALGLTYHFFEALLQRSDFVILAMPLTSETFHLMDAAVIARMKRGSYLVNVGRGSVVDEQAVAKALASGHLGGYAADVFEMEDCSRPHRPQNIPGSLLRDRYRTVFTPHLGSAVGDIRRVIEIEAASSILQALSGEQPHGAINSPERHPKMARSLAETETARRT